MSRKCRKCVICSKEEYKSDDEVFFTTFPLDESRCKEWIKLVGNPELVFLPIEKLHKNRHICGDHFDKKCFNRKKNRLKKIAIPTLKLTSPPLTDQQLQEFPFHVWSYRKEQIPVASTSQILQSSVTLQKENDPIPAASTSKNSQSSMIIHHENDGTPKEEMTSTSLTCSKGDQSNKRKLDENTDMTPRKKKLVQTLRKTRCTLASLRRSATLIENIESPILKDMVLSACKNQKRKPTGKRWTTQHKISCLAILKRSAKTYRYLRHVIPLPSVKTLQNVLRKIPMAPGINKSVLQHLKDTGEQKTPKEKICALVFDEIALKPRLIFNPSLDLIDGFQDLGSTQEEGRSNAIADHALVFLLQGMYKKFKQPVAFYFVKGTISSEKLAAIIKEIICAVTETGYRILTTVCDQGPTNMGALKLLRQFSYPTDNNSENSFTFKDQVIYTVYDVPHLFKSIRNNFFKNGLLKFDGKTAKWEHLIAVEEKNRNFLYLSKISPTHVAPKYRAKMRVKYAAQILSNTVAAVLKLLSEAEKDNTKAAELMATALVVQELDRLFDCTNGPSCADDIKKGLRQNVSVKTNHLEEWAKFEQKLQTMQFINSAGTSAVNIKCIQGYIISLKSLRSIWTEVKKIKYFNLRQVNQDSLENLFGIIRQHSPTNTNPTCAHFISALKTAVVTGLTAPHSRSSNCQKDGNALLTDFRNLVFGSGSNEPATENTPGLILNAADSVVDVPVLSMPEEEYTEMEENLIEVSEQPVVYISGYIASKILKNHKCEDCLMSLTVVDPEIICDPTYSYIRLREWWTDKCSLTYPSKPLCILIQNATKIVEKEICPILYRPNICQLTLTMFSTECDTKWFNCAQHKSIIFEKIYCSLGQLLIRRQCQRLNQGMALQEEALADSVKRAQQQGKAK